MATGSFRLPVSAPSGSETTFLQLTFDSISGADLMVGDSSDVSDWNTFFDLPVNGNPFTRVQVMGRIIFLYGGSNITLQSLLMGDYQSDPRLQKIIDFGSISTIGYDAFTYSTGLTDLYLSSCTEVESDPAGQGAFFGCSSLVHVEMPLLTTLGDHVFEGDTSVLEFNLPLLETAGASCFYGCSSILAFGFPSLTSADDNCFNACTAATFTLPHLASAGLNCFYGCSSAYTLEFPLLETAGDYCFAGCSNTSVFDLPLLVSAGEYCFTGCNGMSEYDFTSLETAGNNCFSGCSSVTAFDLPALTAAGTYCFNNCSSSASFDLPLLETVGDYCFANCGYATSYYLPSVESLGTTTGDDYVFDSIYSMEISLIIPSSLMTCNEGEPDSDISTLVVNNTVTITQIDLPFKITFDNITTADLLVGDSSDVADWNTFFDLPTNGTPFSSVVVAGNDVSLLGGSGITILDNLFNGDEMDMYDGILAVDDTAGSVIALGTNCFCYQNALISVSFPNVTSNLSGINDDGIFYSESLLTASFPKLVNLGYYLFNGCEALETVRLPYMQINEIGARTFQNCKTLVTDEFISRFTNLSTLGDACFRGCRALVNPQIPSSITTLGTFVFQNCYGLVNPDFTAQLTSIGNYCFQGCTGLVNPDFSSLETAGISAFQYCGLMQEPDFSALVSADDWCFYNCVSLISDFPVLETAGDSCFANCGAFQTPDFPALTTTAQYAFSGCEGLTTLNFPALTTVGEACFYGCIDLISISLPVCTSLGGTTGLNYVFHTITGNTITLTIPTALMTCNGGSPDGDIAYLNSNNTLTIIQV